MVLNYNSKSIANFRDIIAIAIFSLIIYVIYGIAWPLSPGRDIGSYIAYFVQMWHAEPGYEKTMLWRTPITPLFIGIFNKLGGVLLLEITMGFFYSVAVICTYLIGSHFNRLCGVTASVALLFFPSYGHLFHEMGSDAIFACAFLCWVVFIMKKSGRIKFSDYALHGLIVFLLVMIRPSSQLYWLFFLFPLCDNSFPLRRRILASGVFIVTLFCLLSVYKTYNFIRYDNFVVTRGTSAFMPLKKIMVHYRLVKIGNGPNTDQMAQLFEDNVLIHEPYVSYQVTKEMALEKGGARVLYDMKELCDEIYGKESNYRVLQMIALEAIVSNPISFFRQIMLDMMTLFFVNPEFNPSIRSERNDQQKIIDRKTLKEEISARLEDKTLFEDIIPISYYELKLYRDEDTFLKILEARQMVQREGVNLPSRDGNAYYARLFNFLSRSYPGMIYFLLPFVAVFYWIDYQKKFTLLGILMLSLASVLIPSLAINQVWQYRQPFDPIFICCGVIAFVRHGIPPIRNDECLKSI